MPGRENGGRLPHAPRRWWVARTAGARVLEASGALRIWDRLNGSAPKILYYHDVHGPEDDVSWCREPSLTISARLFREHLESLVKHYTILDINQVVAAPSPRRIAITFDDGYRGVYEHAFPLLRQWGIPATIFLVTNNVGSAEVLWWDRLLTAVERLRGLIPSEQELRTKHLPANWSGLLRQSPLEHLLDAYKLGNSTERNAVDQVIAELVPPVITASRRIFLNEDEIHQMAAAGLTFGAHTISHPLLPWIDDQRLRQELRGSLASVLSLTHQRTCWFSYPDGTFGDREEREVISAGFEGAVQTGRRPERGGRFALPRVGISPRAITTAAGKFSPWRSRWVLGRFSRRRLTNVLLSSRAPQKIAK